MKELLKVWNSISLVKQIIIGLAIGIGCCGRGDFPRRNAAFYEGGKLRYDFDCGYDSHCKRQKCSCTGREFRCL